MAHEKYLDHTENLPFFWGIVPYVTTDCNQGHPQKRPPCAKGAGCEADWGIAAIPPSCLRQATSLYTREAFLVGKSYASIVDDEKTAFEQRDKHRQNGHKKSATSIVAAFADKGG